MTRPWFTRLTFVTVVLTLLIGALLLLIVKGDRLDALENAIGEARSILGISRLLLIIAIIAAWPTLLRVCHRQRWIRSDTHRILVTSRWRLAAWLIVLELMLGLQALNHLHSLIGWILT